MAEARKIIVAGLTKEALLNVNTDICAQHPGVPHIIMCSACDDERHTDAECAEQAQFDRQARERAEVERDEARNRTDDLLHEFSTIRAIISSDRDPGEKRGKILALTALILGQYPSTKPPAIVGVFERAERAEAEVTKLRELVDLADSVLGLLDTGAHHGLIREARAKLRVGAALAPPEDR